jgi:hypothetical protein
MLKDWDKELITCKGSEKFVPGNPKNLDLTDELLR